MSNTNTLAVALRTGKGKGAARRARREGQVPAVLYGHGTDPKHLLLPARELAAILRNNGLNAIIELDIEGDKQLALTKQVDVHALRNYIEHVDLLVVKRGEKVTVEVAVVVEGDAVSGSLVVQDASVVEVEAEALHIPEQIVASVEGLGAGSSITAGDLTLPAGVTLVSDAGTLIVAVNETKGAAAGDDEAEAPADAEAAAE
ncbi:50S ribosomal protein L25 [Gordonia spumicola]|uniref:Large ribosomal subunit protein bL25 n=1 Tax=Gordonia spumicola TaxID=589161 RepID=A0A7I9V756_9ACTN|nr:50S ribosomal protein L25/general stress protein Ctc [Gordonia spumicola]GEE00913.1 50S ribosomal protein L25 [Gordonia spumicola]